MCRKERKKKKDREVSIVASIPEEVDGEIFVVCSAKNY